MRKLSDKEKAELQAKIERAQRERIRRIGEHSEEVTSPLSVGGAFHSLLRAVFRRRDSDVAERTPRKTPRAFPVWIAFFFLLFMWLFGLSSIITGTCLVVMGFRNMRGAQELRLVIKGVIIALPGLIMLPALLFSDAPMPTPKTLRKFKALRHFTLGNIYREQGELDEAIAQYESAIGINTESEGARAGAHFNLGSIYQERGDNEQAVDHFREFVPLARTDPVLQHRIPEVQEWIQQLGDSEPEN